MSILTSAELREFEAVRRARKVAEKRYDVLRKKILFIAKSERTKVLSRGTATALIDVEFRTNIDWEKKLETVKGPDYVNRVRARTPKQEIKKIRIVHSDLGS